MEAMTYKEYLTFLLEHSTERSEQERLQREIDGIEETKNRIKEFQEDFNNLTAMKEKELQAPSVEMRDVETRVYQLLNDAEGLNVRTLNSLYYYIRDKYVAAANRRKAREIKERRANNE